MAPPTTELVFEVLVAERMVRRRVQRVMEEDNIIFVVA